MKAWLGLAVTLLLAGAGALWHLSGETADTKRRVETVEKRQEEDRRETKETLRDIRSKTESTDKNVQEIRILLESMKRERSGR